MLRESGASSTLRLLDSTTSALEYWVARSSQAMTPTRLHEFRFRAEPAPYLLVPNIRPHLIRI
jgi:hypothetical protein